MTEEAARSLVFAVLRQEYRAHRPLWRGSLGFALAAALTAGLVFEQASPLHYIASVFLVLGILYLVVLLALKHELRIRSAELPPQERPAFLRGVASGILRASLPAVLAIIVCSTVLLVLAYA